EAAVEKLAKLRSGTWLASLINKDPSTMRVYAASDLDPQIAEYIKSMQRQTDAAPPFALTSRVVETGEAVLMPNVPLGDFMDAVSRLERLTALRSVQLAITAGPDLRLTLRVILDQAVQGLSIDAADVLLVDESDGLLSLVASTGFRSTSIPDYRLPVDEGMPG